MSKNETEVEKKTNSVFNDPIFAKKVKSGEQEDLGGKVHWLNGTAAEHNAFFKLMADHKTRQQAYEKCVFTLACDENGKHRFKGRCQMSEFHELVDRTYARNFALMILGITDSDEDGKTEFEKELEDEAKK